MWERWEVRGEVKLLFLSWAGSTWTRTTITQTLLPARQSGRIINQKHTQIYILYLYSGDDPNKPCVFPFTYEDETISSCTTIDGDLKVCYYGTGKINITDIITIILALVCYRAGSSGKTSAVNGVTVVLTVLRRMMSGSLMTLWQWQWSITMMKTTKVYQYLYLLLLLLLLIISTQFPVCHAWIPLS